MTSIEDIEKEEEREKTIALILGLVRERYDRELESANKLDDESRQLIGSVLVVIGFLLGAGAIDLLSFSSWSSVLYFVGIIVLIISIVLAYKAIRHSRAYYEPDPKGKLKPDIERLLIEKASPRPYLTIARGQILSIIEIIRNNENINRTKAHLISTAWFFLIPGLSMVVLFIIVSLLNPPQSPD